MFERQPFGHLAGALVGLACAVGSANAQQLAGCGELPNHAALAAALDKATAEEMSGLNNQMWATLVDRDGVVCAVAFSGANRAAQWPWSRVISAQKASTANAFSLDSSSNSAGSGQATGLALSTANLYATVQPGGSLYGLQFSNPVDTDVAYRGPQARHGTPMDPMVGNRVGGVNVFGGGLGLFATGKRMVGALGGAAIRPAPTTASPSAFREISISIISPALGACRVTTRGRTTSCSTSTPAAG